MATRYWNATVKTAAAVIGLTASAVFSFANTDIAFDLRLLVIGLAVGVAVLVGAGSCFRKAVTKSQVALVWLVITGCIGTGFVVAQFCLKYFSIRYVQDDSQAETGHIIVLAPRIPADFTLNFYVDQQAPARINSLVIKEGNPLLVGGAPANFGEGISADAVHRSFIVDSFRHPQQLAVDYRVVPAGKLVTQFADVLPSNVRALTPAEVDTWFWTFTAFGGILWLSGSCLLLGRYLWLRRVAP